VAPFCGSKPLKTDKRDAQDLARNFRSGDLSGIYVPTPEEEAIRDLVRARDAAIRDQRRVRSRLKGFLLRLDFRYTGKTSWTQAHENYLAMLTMPSPAQQLVFEEYKQTITEATERVERLTAALPQHLDGWKWKPVVQALMCMRGIDVLHGMVLVAEVGDFSRFVRRVV
jgi:transposase